MKASLTSRILMIIGALLILALFIFPMWNITLEAPQYPEAIGMDIWVNKITDHNPNDLKNINLMNHYVGMNAIPEKIPEFEYFPYIVIGMSILGIIFGWIGRRNLFLVWFCMMVILGTLGMYDFYLWEYDYGHNLDPTAAIKVPGQAYQPPLIGSKVILNFKAISSPMIGAYFLFTGILTALIAYFVARKQAKQ
ncbi:MAG: hypothetical protein KDD32_05380 [Bacteroidetes bacterium]|nr:hypothetical protein [Bacteroidota bacterium]